MSDEDSRGAQPPRTESRPAATRLLGVGARGAERLASATGVDQALEDAVEEAIVRALRSPAVERAIERLLLRNAVQDALEKALTSDEVAEAVVNALDAELADRVWEELLASNKAQMLVERIAEAPEVRAAIAQQGAGLVTDIGRRLTKITEALDDGAERIAHGIFRRPGHEAETDQVGLVTRVLATAADLGLLGIVFSIFSGLLSSVAPVLVGQGDAELSPLAAAILSGLAFTIGGAIFVAFWALAGQTPGMRFLSIKLDAGGTSEIGLRRALKRLLAVPLALIPLGLGFFAILLSPTRQGWHDRIAGTEVIYDTRAEVAPWAVLDPREPALSSRASGRVPPADTGKEEGGKAGT